MTDFLNNENISTGLKTKFVGRNFFVFDELDSTNTTASEMAAKGAAEGTLIVADRQKAGRGRLGRTWYSPAGVNIYLSVILRPSIRPALVSQLTLVTAVALVDALSLFITGTSGNKAEIKWPNDILVNGKKCAGILSEMKMDKSDVDFVVLGIGVNVNLINHLIPSELSDIMTSLLIERDDNVAIDRTTVLQSICEKLESWYIKYQKNGFGEVRKAWNSYSGINGRSVTVASSSMKSGEAGKYETGKALGINDVGALLLKKEDGEVVEVYAGDIIL